MCSCKQGARKASPLCRQTGRKKGALLPGEDRATLAPSSPCGSGLKSSRPPSPLLLHRWTASLWEEGPSSIVQEAPLAPKLLPGPVSDLWSLGQGRSRRWVWVGNRPGILDPSSLSQGPSGVQLQQASRLLLPSKQKHCAHKWLKMQKAVRFDKEKYSCNSCLTRGCSFINAKWSINQGWRGVAWRCFPSTVINLVPGLMKNEGERLGARKNGCVTQRLIMGCNGAVDLPAWAPAQRHMRPPASSSARARRNEASKSGIASCQCFSHHGRKEGLSPPPQTSQAPGPCFEINSEKGASNRGQPCARQEDTGAGNEQPMVSSIIRTEQGGGCAPWYCLPPPCPREWGLQGISSHRAKGCLLTWPPRPLQMQKGARGGAVEAVAP